MRCALAWAPSTVAMPGARGRRVCTTEQTASPPFASMRGEFHLVTFFPWGFMSDPRDVAHDKKVAQEKKHEGTEATPEDGPVAQPGKKPPTAKNKRAAVAGAGAGDDTSAGTNPSVPSASLAAEPAAALAGSLVVLAQLKDLEFHSRANLERLAALTMTVEDELKQKEIVGLLGEVYSAQNAVQTKLTTLIESYNAECERLQAP